MKRDNSGTIGKNDRRTQDNHPTHSGSAMIDGREYWVNGWVKNSDRGSFLSLSFRPKEPRANSIPVDVPFNDDIPF